ncbi:RNA polymerase II-associated protein 3 isoform X3 [Neltuma alba]|uniref:RNA polymerase II-associated protein 3 isoform X3 n=1 Tax=Neltuma alba TaxID=207710 RepID=UPI0010A2EE5B|nr:RNA polymerase II-associated protein 3 isoform X3 [Prosopis alba]
MDFQGFLNDLQDWELSRKDKTRKMKSQALQKEKVAGGGTASRGETFFTESTSGHYDFSRNKDSFDHVHSSFTAEDVPNAASEKELGNEYFKQKKFKEAIDCYSRSIAFSPTAVAYANKAMAFIKIRRFQQAEDDCTEALNLDDRYIKAYSRRATARKELGKLKEAMEDAEFALRLEPENQEIKKQYADIKSLYENEILQKASGALGSSLQVTQKLGESATNTYRGTVHPVPNVAEKSGAADLQDHTKGHNRINKQEMKASVQHLASHVASRVMAEAAKNITPPNSAYQFEVSWRGFSGDPALQARLLKAISPQDLPKIFKNALSSALLMDIIKCVASFFTEDTALAVSYIEHLTKVSRFDMLIVCLTSTDKHDLRKIWEEVFCNEATPMEYAEILDNLRSKYCIEH